MKAIKKINLLDLFLLATIIFSFTGYIYAKAEKTSLNKIIEGKENIAIELLIPDVYSSTNTPTNNFFKVGDKAAITIRNRPYTKLTIIKSEVKPKQITIPDLHSSSRTIDDLSRTSIKDYIVTLSDIALKTNDGYVIGGNKVKAGNQIELEGFNYRLNGKVINVYPLIEQRAGR